MPELILTRAAREDLADLTPSTRSVVGAALDRLLIDPTNRGKPLLGRLRGLWSARVGNYRTIFFMEPDRDPRRIVIRAIRHRAVAYGRRRRRR